MGETPLEALDRFRADMPEYKEEKLSYAGRLDPLAEGVMLVLIGEANKEREKYLGLNKEYECEMLVGVETDTYDVLGIPKSPLARTVLVEKITEIDFQKYVGKFAQDYPPYSSKTVAGKPMFEYAREGRLGEIEIPKKAVEIFSIEKISTAEIQIPEILNKIKEITTLVKGDFRQKEILVSWEENLANLSRSDLDTFSLISFKISCSSGTYIRSLVHRIGQDLGTGACVYKLKRTKIISS